MGLLAVIGPSRKDHVGLPRFFSRRRSNALVLCQKSRIDLSRAEKSISVATLLKLDLMIRQTHDEQKRLVVYLKYPKVVKLSRYIRSFTLRQIGPHWKMSMRKIQRLFVIHEKKGRDKSDTSRTGTICGDYLAL